MNAVEIEEAVTALAERPFDAAEFPFAFLEAFGNKETTIKRLRAGTSNKSDLGGVLQSNNIHIAVAPSGEVTKTLAALKASPATKKSKAQFVLATDGDTFEAEDLTSDEAPVACAYADFCPPTGTGVKHQANDLFHTPLDQAQINFENEGGETYICGNPPYVGDKKQNHAQKSDIEGVFGKLTSSWKSLDYICGFFWKAAEYICRFDGACAFVSTNSIVQGQHVPRFWSLMLDQSEIFFGVTSFKWSNLATNKAGVTCVVVGICPIKARKRKEIFEGDNVRRVENISPYLIPGPNVIVAPASKSISDLSKMTLGNVPKDDGGLLMTQDEFDALGLSEDQKRRWTKIAFGSTELIQGRMRYCLWLSDDDLAEAIGNEGIARRIEHVRQFRTDSVDAGMAPMAARPHQFREMNIARGHAIVVPRVSSENREYLPAAVIDSTAIITDRNYALYDNRTAIRGGNAAHALQGHEIPQHPR